jgi:hypothetical protein
MRKLLLAITAVASLANAAACTDSASSIESPDASAASDDLLLLPGGNHAAMIVGFNAKHPVGTAAAIDARWREALGKGMRLGRVQLDWVDLEPRAGVYVKDELEEQLGKLSKDNLAPYLSVTGFDNEEFPLPADLAARIKSGELTYKSPVIIERYSQLMDWVVPMLLKHRGWVIALGNEPANFIEALPTTEARTKLTNEILEFVAAIRTKIKSIEPKLAVTVTVSEGRSPTEIKDGVDIETPFVIAGDVATYNFYGARFDENSNYIDASDPADVRGRIDAMIAKAAGRPIVLQELGAQAGPDRGTSLMGSSLETQKRFFETVFAELKSRPKFRAAYVFQLVDWDPDLVKEVYSEPLRKEGVPSLFIRQYAESLETVGLIRFSDGTPRPAWSTFLKAL